MSNITLRHVSLSPKIIDFDQRNPRGESISQITKDHEFEKLKKSIKEFGILEPLIVKENATDPQRYSLIDGERRLRAALATKAKMVPTLVATSQVNGRILAYQIHKLRKDWSKITEVKSIKSIVQEIRSDNPEITTTDIKKRILEITGMKAHDAEDLIKLSYYDDKIIAAAINGNLSMSYLVQIESNFVRPVIKKFPKILNKFNEDKIRQILAEKAMNGKLGNTRYLMDIFKEVFSHHSDTSELILLEFLHKKEMDIAFSYDCFKENKTPKPLTEYIPHPQSPPNELNPKPESNLNNTNETFPKKTENQISTSQGLASNKTKIPRPQSNSITLSKIRAEYNKISASLNEIEKRYIMEAIECLERRCFKAAILMIWAASIAKVHSLIDKDLNGFNNASVAMKADPKSVYKHLAIGFMSNAKDMNGLKTNSNDIQLLCYLYYKDIISDTQFKKMRGNYDKRCDCAHPTDITLTDNEVVAIFENALEYIFANEKLQ